MKRLLRIGITPNVRWAIAVAPQLLRPSQYPAALTAGERQVRVAVIEEVPEQQMVQLERQLPGVPQPSTFCPRVNGLPQVRRFHHVTDSPIEPIDRLQEHTGRAEEAAGKLRTLMTCWLSSPNQPWMWGAMTRPRSSCCTTSPGGASSRWRTLPNTSNSIITM
jgi:hypothetical protein